MIRVYPGTPCVHAYVQWGVDSLDNGKDIALSLFLKCYWQTCMYYNALFGSNMQLNAIALSLLLLSFKHYEENNFAKNISHKK